MQTDSIQEKNPLGYEKVEKLLVRFAVPSVIAGIVGALYNIVDQIFIGHGVGVLGNAATNVSFPLVTICISLALLFGIGGASGFSLALGQENTKKAARVAAGSAVWMWVFGFLLMLLVLLFLEPMLLLFGADAEVLPYAASYTGVLAYGLPFFLFSSGFTHLIRADGNPKYSMVCVLSGAVLNTILDPIFIFGMHMGMAGAALATVIAQGVSALLCLFYLFHFRTVSLEKTDFFPNIKTVSYTVSLGIASCINQIAMTVTQIVMNNLLTHYGAASIYGSAIPLAAVGVISKVNFIFLSVIIGIAQGNQPIVGFNYGAKNYSRVRKTYKNALLAATVVAFLGFACFQLFPRSIISLFGSGSEAYYQFATHYLRIFMLCFFLIGIQPITSNFLTSIGKANKGVLLALSRQILFLLPLVFLFSILFGIDGILYAGPLADIASAVLALSFVRFEFSRMKQLEKSLLV